MKSSSSETQKPSSHFSCHTNHTRKGIFKLKPSNIMRTLQKSEYSKPKKHIFFRFMSLSKSLDGLHMLGPVIVLPQAPSTVMINDCFFITYWCLRLECCLLLLLLNVVLLWKTGYWRGASVGATANTDRLPRIIRLLLCVT